MVSIKGGINKGFILGTGVISWEKLYDVRFVRFVSLSNLFGSKDRRSYCSTAF